MMGSFLYAQLTSTEERNALIEKVQRWLKEENAYKFEVSPKDYADFSLVIHPPQNEQLNIDIFMEKEKTDRISFAVNIGMDSNDQKTFSYLNIETQRRLIRDLKFGLLQLNIEFRFFPNEERFERILISTRLFSDGLHKNMFFDTIFRLIRSVAFILMKLEETVNIRS